MATSKKVTEKKKTNKTTKKEVVVKKKNTKKKEKIETSLLVLPIPPEDEPLNHAELAFIDEYMIDYNATKSYMRARGYEEYKPSYRVVACRWLAKDNIKKEIEERKNLLHNERVADANEILEFYTQVLRGEVKDQLGFETSVRDRMKAGEKLAQRYGVFEDSIKQSNKNDGAKEPPKLKIIVTDNSNLEEVMYENMEGSVEDGK